MDAEKFVLLVTLVLTMALVVAVSLAFARRFKIKLPWDPRIAGCPRCGAAEEFGHGITLQMIGSDGPVVRGSPRYGSTTDLINVAALMGGLGATMLGCVLLLTGAAAWVVGSGMGLGERVIVGLIGVGGAMVALHLGIHAGMWGWRQRFLPPVVKCKCCGWPAPKTRPQ
jgi:hypothetical protein